MRRLLLLLAGMILPAASAAAQDSYPRAEIFGGASYFRSPVSVGYKFVGYNFGGWHASVSGNVHKNFGIVADLAGQYGHYSRRSYEYMLGPRFQYRSDHATFFAHALYGGLTALQDSDSEGTGFLMAYGFGVDVNLGKRVAVRVLQFDYMADRSHDQWGRDLRASFGVVFRLGGQR